MQQFFSMDIDNRYEILFVYQDEMADIDKRRWVPMDEHKDFHVQIASQM